MHMFIYGKDNRIPHMYQICHDLVSRLIKSPTSILLGATRYLGDIS